MIVIAGILAVIAAFVTTYVWASVDAGREIAVDNPIVETVPPPPTTASNDEPTSTSSTLPEILNESDLAKKVAGSVRAVQTLDEAGQRVEGTAFVVGSFGGQTYLLTSFAVVRANTKSPGPGITLNSNQRATLWTWQEDRDLALLVVPGQIESLAWAGLPPQKGEKIWAGGAGQKLAVGVVLTASETAIDHNIFVDDVRQGAPIVNNRGEVLGMVSRVYNPNNRGTDSLYTAVPIRIACERMLRCGGGNTSAAAPATTSTTRR